MPELSNQLLRDEADHLAACSECDGAWQERRSLAAGMRRLSGDLRATEAPSRVEAGLVAAFRAQSLRQSSMPPRGVWVPLFAGIAAALLLAIGLLLLRDQPVERLHHTSTSTVELASAPIAVDDDADADGFIPLPNAERIAPDENVNVVRVEVPRSAMLAVGLTVSAEQSSDLVEADVKMGANGLARAVRFINE
jgi:hypothetical protein